MINLKIKRMYYYLLTLFLIFFLCFIFIRLFVVKVNPKIIIIARDTFKKNIIDQITQLSGDITINNNFNNLLNIDKNENNEILYASYNLPKCYEVLSNISSSLNNKLSLQSFDLKEPLFIGSNYAFFASLGPKVNIKINYIDMSLSNIYTKITDYGMNNALIEMYVTINIKGRIFTPVLEQEETIKYDMLISSMIINGRVPTFYGGMITTSSNYFDIPILM